MGRCVARVRHAVETNLYTSDGIKIRMDTLCQKSDELGGMAVNDLRIRRGIANLLNPNGMAGSEIVDAPCVSMSLRKVVWEKSATNDHRLGEVRFLSRSPTNANKLEYDEIFFRRSFNVDCTDCNVHVWLSYIDCGRLESAASLRCDSNPVP